MKTIKSPLKDRNVNNNIFPFKKNPYDQNNRSLRQNYDAITQNHQRQHKKNSNSIKLVLKQLTDLKKQLKDLKNNKVNVFSNQTLDMSQCRKNNLARKSSQSPTYNQRIIKSSSNSKSKSNSLHKDISTQTKHIKSKDVNQFSFSIDSKSGKHHKNHKKQRQSQSQQSLEQRNTTALKKKSELPTKRQQNQSYSKEYNKRYDISDTITALQASELYQKHILLLKNTFNVLQISTNIFSVDEKLNLNIQFQRLSKNIGRVPIFNEKPNVYYESIGMYARNINNQLNNLIILLNRCDNKSQKLKQREIIKNKQEIKQLKSHIVAYCQKCQQNQKKGIEKMHKRQLKKFQKEISKIQDQLQQKNEEIKQLYSENNLLKNQLQNTKIKLSENNKIKIFFQANQQITKIKIKQLQIIINELKTQINREKQKKQLIQQDLKYYKLQFQRIKKQYRSEPFQRRQIKKQIQLQQKIKQAEQIKNQLQKQKKQFKQKQQIYQQIIKQKQLIIFQMQKQKQKYLNQLQKIKIKNNLLQSIKIHQKQTQIIKIQDYYQLRIKLQQKNNAVKQLQQQLKFCKNNVKQQKQKNVQINNALQLCLDQINKLHIQIDNLQQANEKYKDKFVKTKIINQKISKRQQAQNNKKGQTLQQINALIKHHRQNIIKNK